METLLFHEDAACAKACVDALRAKGVELLGTPRALSKGLADAPVTEPERHESGCLTCRVDIVNSVGCEGIARRCLAIEWTYKMGGPCSPGALEFFAAKLCSTSSDVRVPAADRAVRRRLAFNASFAKLARRAARVSDASTAWW